MITVENLSMDFTGKAGSAKALSDVSFAISAGEILGIVGKSGAGKTTLLRLLSFQMRPNSGRILIEGEPVDHTTSARALRISHALTWSAFHSSCPRSTQRLMRWMRDCERVDASWKKSGASRPSEMPALAMMGTSAM